MSANNPLVRDLQGQLKVAAADLRARSEEPGLQWAEALRGQYDAALAAGRTSLSWSEWRDGEVEQAAVAWVLATVFVRFCEDNGLLDDVLIAGEGQRQAMAVDADVALLARDDKAGHLVQDAQLPARRAGTSFPRRIRLAKYPQLRSIAWGLAEDAEVGPTEAFQLYERNWRHVEMAAMEPAEQALLAKLTATIGKGVMNV